MIHLSVAIGRFMDALFWGIFRTAGWVAMLVIGAAMVLIAVLAVGNRLWRGRS